MSMSKRLWEEVEGEYDDFDDLGERMVQWAQRPTITKEMKNLAELALNRAQKLLLLNKRDAQKNISKDS